jgi:hypothetical protein
LTVDFDVILGSWVEFQLKSIMGLLLAAIGELSFWKLVEELRTTNGGN